MKAVVSKWKDFSNQVNQDSSKASIVTIMSKDGKFLLVKRGMTAHWEPGKWGLVGGFIHKGEDPHDGAVREVFEETKIFLPNVLYCFSRGNVMHFLSCLPQKSEEIEVQLDFENDDYTWVNLEEIEALETTPECKNNIIKCLR